MTQVVDGVGGLGGVVVGGVVGGGEVVVVVVDAVVEGVAGGPAGPRGPVCPAGPCLGFVVTEVVGGDDAPVSARSASSF